MLTNISSLFCYCAIRVKVEVVHGHFRLSVGAVLSVLQLVLEDQQLICRQPAKEGRDACVRLVICAGVSWVMISGRSLVIHPVGDSAMWQSGGCSGL